MSCFIMGTFYGNSPHTAKRFTLGVDNALNLKLHSKLKLYTYMFVAPDSCDAHSVFIYNLTYFAKIQYT